jgi:hypothetical protein
MAPSAFAQISTSQVPGVDAVTDTVSGGSGGGGTSSGDSGGGGTVGGVTDTVKNTVDTTIGTTDKATGGVVSNTDKATGGVVSNTDKATGGVVSNTDTTVKNTGNTLVEQTQKTVENTARDAGTTVHNTVGGANDLGGSVTGPLLNPKDRTTRDRTTHDRNGDGKVSPAERDRKSPGNKAAYRGELAGDRGSRKASDRTKFGSLAAAEKKMRNFSSTPASAVVPARESFMTQLAEAATQAAKTLAFPLGLALMVGAFLMVQGRIDRKDAKLVLAPIDSEQDLLSFQ